MKKSVFIGILLFAYIAGIYGQSSMYDKFSNHKDITSVYVSKALLSMIPDISTKGANLEGLSKKLDQIEIYTGNTEVAIKLMKSEFESIKKNKAYEVLMQVKDGDEEVFFYAQKGANDKFKDLIMFTSELSECTIIHIVGNFTAEDIQGVMD